MMHLLVDLCIKIQGKFYRVCPPMKWNFEKSAQNEGGSVQTDFFKTLSLPPFFCYAVIYQGPFSPLSNQCLIFVPNI